MKASRKFLIVIIPIFILTMSTVTLAQTYSIKSLDGKIAKVTLSYKTFSKRLTVSCANDTLYLLDYTGTQKTQIVNQRFIKVEYDVLGGTGVINRNTLILSIIQNKIITSLLVNSHFEGFSSDKHILYDVKLNFKSGLGRSYEISADISNQVKSKNNSTLNRNSIKKVNLRFDTNYNIFISNIENLSHSFKVYKPEYAAGFTEKFLSGEKPEVQLGKSHKYLFVDNCWYAASTEGNATELPSLVPYSFKVN
jgi:hypothetical protein